MSFNLTYNTKDLEDLTERYPHRVKWATGEAIKMSGGHIRKKIRNFIESGGRGWKPLSPITRKSRGGSTRSPLYNLGKLVRFKYRGGKNPRVRIGFFTATRRGKIGFSKRERERFKSNFGMTPQALAKKHEFGKRVRITHAKRSELLFAGIKAGMPLRKKTKFVTIPARPMIGPIFRQEKGRIPKYVEEKFWQKMNSRGGLFGEERASRPVGGS